MPGQAETGRFCRLGLTILALAVAALVACQALIAASLQTAQVFGAYWTPVRAEGYGRLSGSVDPLVVKYGHALRSDRFRYGLFGSSRAMGISHWHLGLGADEFFNFSTGSTGFRQSTALIQALHDAGKAPETVLVTLDNHDIRYFRHVEWPNALASPGYHLGYLRDELRAGASPVLLVKAIAEVVAVAVRDLVTRFNIDRLSAVVDFYRPPATIAPNLFRPDGSRDMETLGRTQPPLVTYSTAWPSMVAGMKADLARLGRIAGSGIRIIIYETPIAPHLTAAVEAQRDDATRRLRDEISAACRQHGLTCLPPPEPDEADRDLIWTSCCHAPPHVLARYISGQL